MTEAPEPTIEEQLTDAKLQAGMFEHRYRQELERGLNIEMQYRRQLAANERLNDEIIRLNQEKQETPTNE